MNIRSGLSPSNFEVTNRSGNLFIKVDDLNYSNRVQLDSNLKVNIHQKYQKIKKGSTLFPKRGAAIMTNKIRILGEDSYMDTNMMALEPDGIVAEFLYIFISRTGLYKIADTSTIPQINNKHIEPYEISLPNLNEQVKIGKFFKRLDDIITLHQRNIEQVKELKHGYLQQLFPKNNELFPSVRFANFNGEWELRKLGELAKWTRGNGLSKSVLNKKGIGAEVIHYADLYKFGATINNVVNWSDSDQGTLIPLNSLLFPMSDVTSFGLARTSTINRLGVKASGDTLIATITSKENSQFISYQINASPKNILSLVTGTTVRHISSQNLSSLIIKLPSICEQTQIGNFFKQLDHIITIHQQKIDKLNHLKKAYLQNMFI